MEATPELKQYRGNCHCGLFKFAIKVPPLTSVRTCNCSVCSRNAYEWIWPIAEENLVVESGDGAVSVYEFGKKDMKHFFCPVCGSSVMGRRREAPADRSIGINARMIKHPDLDLSSLEKLPFPGQNLEPKYQPPPFPSHDEHGEVEEGLTVYNGNCHCGAVTYTVKTKPFTDVKVIFCNCSLCSRNGDLWIHPPKSAVKLHGAENLTDYAFLSKDSLHSFCKICGVSVVVKVTDPKVDIMPINVRTIDGIDLDTLNFHYYDGRSNDPQYSV